jgi:outer membrane biosynthesis protein TonB
MRFSSIAVLALVAPVANAFAPIQRQYSAPRTVLKANVEYDLDLGIEEVPKPKKGGKKTAPAPEPEPKPEPVAAPKSKKRSAAKKVVEPPPAPAPVEKKRKGKKGKTTPVPPPPPPSSVKKVKTVSSASTSTKASGVALGAAPLVLAPVVLLGAGRSLLQGTKARREKIQKEIDDFEKSKKKNVLEADVDGGDLAKAVVR